MEFHNMMQDLMKDLPDEYKVLHDENDFDDEPEVVLLSTIDATSEGEGHQTEFKLYNTDSEGFTRIQGIVTKDGKTIGELLAWLNESKSGNTDNNNLNFHEMPGLDVSEEAHLCFTSLFDHNGKVRAPFNLVQQENQQQDDRPDGILLEFPCDGRKGVLFVECVEYDDPQSDPLQLISKLLNSVREKYGMAFIAPKTLAISSVSESVERVIDSSRKVAQVGFQQIADYPPYCELWVAAAPSKESSIKVREIQKDMKIFTTPHQADVTGIDQTLQQAIAQGCDMNQVKELVSKGANIDKVFGLHVAIECGKLETARGLAKLEVDCGARNGIGNTPLHEIAGIAGDEENPSQFNAWCSFAKELVDDLGPASLSVLNLRKETPIDVARRNRQYTEDFQRVFGLEGSLPEDFNAVTKYNKLATILLK